MADHLTGSVRSCAVTPSVTMMENTECVVPGSLVYSRKSHPKLDPRVMIHPRRHSSWNTRNDSVSNRVLGKRQPARAASAPPAVDARSQALPSSDRAVEGTWPGASRAIHTRPGSASRVTSPASSAVQASSGSRRRGRQTLAVNSSRSCLRSSRGPWSSLVRSSSRYLSLRLSRCTFFALAAAALPASASAPAGGSAPGVLLALGISASASPSAAPVRGRLRRTVWMTRLRELRSGARRAYADMMSRCAKSACKVAGSVTRTVLPMVAGRAQAAAGASAPPQAMASLALPSACVSVGACLCRPV
mmetsp:Transcript_25652/g.81641  ORF Transcript_25652/g.81641 Transcript_25652/m.81641 type:complete len:304 (-) Transcript_25652:89-1000(-)